MNANTKTIKVKIIAFPMAAKMTVGADTVDGQILKLTPSGFLIEMPLQGLKTGEKFQVAFEIPITHHQVTEACVIVKLYTTIDSNVIEGHFQSLSLDNEIKIKRFLHSVFKASGSTGA